MNLIIKRYQFKILIILNSENILLYSNNGKKLYNHCQKASLLDNSFSVFLRLIYLINHHSKIGVKKKYIIINITDIIIVSNA